MVKRVYLVTGGMSQYMRSSATKLTEEFCIEAFRMAALRLGMTPAELKEFIHTCYYGHFADHFGRQLLGEALIHDRLGLDPLGNCGVKAGGSTGGATIWEAFKTVASGYSRCVLAMGWENMGTCPTDEGNNLIAQAADINWETELGHLYGNYYALMAARYWKVFGREEESFRRVMAKIAARNHTYAYYNPFAQDGRKLTLEDVLASPIVAYPLRQLDCCLMSVGASCVILADEETAYEMVKKHPDCKMTPLLIDVAAGSHTLRAADRRDMEIPLLPHEEEQDIFQECFPDIEIPLLPTENFNLYKDLGQRFPGADRYPGFTGFLAARMAAYYLYRMMGVTNPRNDFQLFEDHDAFTISSIQTYEDAGFAPYGYGRTYIESGDAFFGGRCPNNISGGLMGLGHPVGSTGIGQVVECMLHLNGIHGQVHGDPDLWRSFGKEKPADWEDLQVPNCYRTLAVSHAGVGSHVVFTGLQHPEHVLEGRVGA